jgi:hypothetical protein
MEICIETYEHVVGTVFDTTAIIKNIADHLNTEVYSWGGKASAEIGVMKNGLCVGVQALNEEIKSLDGKEVPNRRVILISCTTHQSFDGFYDLMGNKIAEKESYAFFGTQWNGKIPPQPEHLKVEASNSLFRQ